MTDDPGPTRAPLAWMNEIAETGAAYGPMYGRPYALEIDGRKFVYVSNGACLAAVEGELAEATAPDDDVRAKCLALLRGRSLKSFDVDFLRLKRWAGDGQGPFCGTCTGLGRVVAPLPVPGERWVPCTGTCGGVPYVRRLGNVSGCVYDLDLLHEILGYLTADRVTVGIVPLEAGRPMVVRSPAPLWKVMLMNRLHGGQDTAIAELPRLEP